MGNTTGQLEGTYMPEWRVYDQGELVRIYYSQQSEQEENTRVHIKESGTENSEEEHSPLWIPISLQRSVADGAETENA
jgi:hypothetical protein